MNHEIFEKTPSINDIKFNSFQLKPVNTLNYGSMRQYVCLPFIIYQLDITTCYVLWKQQQRQEKTKNSKNREYYQPFQIAQYVERLKFGNVERGIVYAQHQSYPGLMIH